MCNTLTARYKISLTELRGVNEIACGQCVKCINPLTTSCMVPYSLQYMLTIKGLTRMLNVYWPHLLSLWIRIEFFYFNWHHFMLGSLIVCFTWNIAIKFTNKNQNLVLFNKSAMLMVYFIRLLFQDCFAVVIWHGMTHGNTIFQQQYAQVISLL